MKHDHRRWIWALAVAAGLGLAACSGASGLFGASAAVPTAMPVVTKEAAVTAEGRVVPNHSVDLAFTQAGRLGQIAVAQGDALEKGALVASLDEQEQALAALRAAEAEERTAQQAVDDLTNDASLATSQAQYAVAQANTRLTEAQKSYDDSQTQDFKDRLDDKETTVQDRKDTLDDRKDDLDKYNNLDPDNTLRRNVQDSYDAAKEDYDQALYERDQLINQSQEANRGLTLAQEELKKAQRELDKVNDGPNKDLLGEAQKQLGAAEANVQAAQRALDDLDLHAPFAGTVAEVRSLEPGDVVTAGQTVVVLVDDSAWYVETTDLTELDVVKLKDGDEVTVEFDALPDIAVNGEVTRIARTYTEKSGDILYQVRIKLTNPPAELRWGMTANVLFDVR
jgi:HlyD family secretion protein